MKLIYLLVGESGSGKTTIAKKMEKWGYKELKSYTTREPRYEDEDSHIFVKMDDFIHHQQVNDIVGYTFFNSNHYWCTRAQLYYNDVYVIDPDGIEYLKQHVDDIGFITIYIDTPLYRRMWRMFKRGDSIGNIIQRLRNDKMKFANVDYDYCVRNVQLKPALLTIKAITRWHDWINENPEEFIAMLCRNE